MHSFTILGVVILCLAMNRKIHCQNNVALDVLTKLNSQIDAIMATNDYETQIADLNTAITNYGNKEQTDFQSITTQLNELSNNIGGLETQTVNLKGRTNGAENIVNLVKSNIDSALIRIGKLETVTMLWKYNFKIVNGTFEQLAKKFKIFTPTMRIPIFVFN